MFKELREIDRGSDRDDVQYLSITELTNLLKLALERDFPRVDFKGEISGVKKAGSGHIYFTLKDENSQIPAVIWRGTVKIDFDLKDGLEVYCQGKVTLYPAQGRLQVTLIKITPAGAGLLQERFLALKKKLEGEGLFAFERKRSLPFLPRAVGVVTSDKGAVIKDIMVKIHERYPNIDVYLVPVRVQGKGAAEEIVEGIKTLNRSGLVDVIIVGRGGGSLEDLWAFNEEVLVRAVFASTIPIVSAVGHESDISLCDLAADVRAPTPTAAAEIVVPRRSDIEARILEVYKRIGDFVVRLDPYWQRLDDVEERLKNSIDNNLHKKKLELTNLISRVKIIEPHNYINTVKANLNVAINKLFNIGIVAVGNKRSVLDERISKLNFAGRHYHNRLLSDFKTVHAKLSALDPREVMGRGFSIVSAGGKVVTKANDIKVGDRVNLTFSVGSGEAEVRSIKE